MKIKRVIVWLTLFLLGCGSASPVLQTSVDDSNIDVEPKTENVQIKGLLGKIDDSIVEEIFSHYLNTFLECYQYNGIDILEEIEGDLGVYLLVGPNGHPTNEIYFESGNLGSEDVQSCIISKIKTIKFPNPIGGDSAKVRYNIPFEAPYDNPDPIDWSGSIIEDAIAGNQEAVDTCLAGQTGVSLTIYVGRGGKVVAAGGVAANMTGYEAAQCLSGEAKKWKFKNPGKYRPAKATIRF